jgi:hypothetical protein
VVESIVRAILDCAWNCWIEASGFLYIWWGGITGGTICMEEGLVFVVVGLIPSSLIDDDWKGGDGQGVMMKIRMRSKLLCWMEGMAFIFCSVTRFKLPRWM